MIADPHSSLRIWNQHIKWMRIRIQLLNEHGSNSDQDPLLIKKEKAKLYDFKCFLVESFRSNMYRYTRIHPDLAAPWMRIKICNPVFCRVSDPHSFYRDHDTAFYIK